MEVDSSTLALLGRLEDQLAAKVDKIYSYGVTSFLRSFKYCNYKLIICFLPNKITYRISFIFIVIILCL